MSRYWFGLLLLGMWFGHSEVARAAAMVIASPDPLDFGDTAVMSPKAVMAPDLSTNQTVTVTIALDTTVPDCNQFAITDPPTPTTPVNLNSSTPRTISVTFTPTSNGMKTCNGIVKQGSNTIGTFTLKGNGVSPQIMVTPAGKSLAFGAIDVNQPSTAQPVTVLNNGNAPLLISSVSFTAGSGDYTMTGPNLPLTLLTTDPAVTWMVACKPSA
ncbi:MAG: choice-of-anchor D domain-containing protein, partial [Deltaproteobacteria bacterium]